MKKTSPPTPLVTDDTDASSSEGGTVIALVTLGDFSDAPSLTSSSASESRDLDNEQLEWGSN